MRNFFDSKWMKHLLGIAGMVNIIAGIFFAFFPQVFLFLFYNKLDDIILSSPAIQSIVTLMFIFILIIGFGYIWSMSNPLRNKLFILIGGMGKIAAVLLWTVSYFQGFGSSLILVESFNDLALGTLFVLYFIYNRKD
jgi:hypothetical protein